MFFLTYKKYNRSEKPKEATLVNKIRGLPNKTAKMSSIIGWTKYAICIIGAVNR